MIKVNHGLRVVQCVHIQRLEEKIRMMSVNKKGCLPHNSRSLQYRRVHISSDEVFSKILKKPSNAAKLAYDFKMAYSGFKTCLRFQDNWDND